MEALGREFNVVPVGDGTWVSLKQADAVSFLGYLASTGDTFTLQEAKDASGTGAQNLACIANYYTSKGDGSGVWAKNTQAKAATVVTTSAAAQSAVVFSVSCDSLSDTYQYVKVTSTGAATVTAILHDLKIQRTPANLTAVGV